MVELWYPGHMAKAVRTLQENMKLVDVVIEVRDARAPLSTSNPDIRRIAGAKPRVVALNKSDLADPSVTGRWCAYLRDRGLGAVAVNSLTGQGIGELVQRLRAAGEAMQEKRRQRGMRERAVRVMVVGIPNVGKSQLINRLAGQTAARTGNTPGITRGKQWIKMAAGFELLDTPGILWPKLSDAAVSLRLALLGAISEGEYDIEEAALALLEHTDVRASLPERYRLPEVPADRIMALEAIGRSRGYLAAGGAVDLGKAAQLLVRDYRAGSLGRISLETPSPAEVLIPEEPGRQTEN